MVQIFNGDSRPQARSGAACGAARSALPTGGVCILVLNWNGASDTIECLESLLASDRPAGTCILVCDNGSDDDSVERLIQWAGTRFGETGCHGGANARDADVALVRTRTNLGYAGGNNAGWRFARDWRPFEYLWVLNNDTRVMRNALTSLLACAQRHPRVAVFGSTLLDYHRPDTVQYAGGARYHPAFTWFRPVHGGRRLDQLPSVPQVPVMDYVVGAACLIRLSALGDGPLFNEDFFLYYEELDLARRLRANGWKLHWCRASRVLHRGGTGAGPDAASSSRGVDRAYHENLSSLRFTGLHHPVLLPFAAPFRLVVKLLLSVVRREPGAIRSLGRAYRDYFLRRRPYWRAGDDRVCLHLWANLAGAGGGPEPRSPLSGASGAAGDAR